MSGAALAILVPQLVMRSGLVAWGTEGEPHFVRKYEASLIASNSRKGTEFFIKLAMTEQRSTPKTQWSMKFNV
jgi:hypothetical protein